MTGPYRRIIASGLAFLFHAWDGGPVGMHNLMDYGRRWQDDPLHAGDHIGRSSLGARRGHRRRAGTRRGCALPAAARRYAALPGRGRHAARDWRTRSSG